ncbi:MAG: cobyric acid synthase [Vulcanimicrobiaceae bacterium]
MSARALMVLGTASHVGKSLMVAALCRILRQDGIRVAPFKAQNMALNSAATPDGLEIGRAQALQAEAAGVSASADMNPILIKPSSECGAQIVVQGRVWGDSSASDYHRHRVKGLFPLVCASYERLAQAYDFIVLEGAGSPAEFNLRDSDIVNMRMAQAADARCVLVGDIDRGGVFAAILGTLALLEPEERARIAGFVINKFRGDLALLAPGVAEFERRIGLPCFGVVSYLRDIGLDEEDSVSLEAEPVARRPAWRDAEGPARRLRIAVIAQPYLSNATDFDPLGREPDVELVYCGTPEALSGADVVILPGTKTTLATRSWLESAGFDPAIRSAPLVFGICGGLQMLGERIDDPMGAEGGGSTRGLALLRLRTTFAATKVTMLASGRLTGDLFGTDARGVPVRGYEIHVGETSAEGDAPPFALIQRAADEGFRSDGACSADGRIAGTYLHGIFDDDPFRHAFISAARKARGLAPPLALASLREERERRIDRLAAHVRSSLDLTALIASPPHVAQAGAQKDNLPMP